MNTLASAKTYTILENLGGACEPVQLEPGDHDYGHCGNIQIVRHNVKNNLQSSLWTTQELTEFVFQTSTNRRGLKLFDS